MTEYNKDKKIKIGDVQQAFTQYIGHKTLTLSERLLVENIWNEIKSELGYE